MSNSKTRDAERTKARIIQASEILFAEKGFARTTINDISQASGTSGALIIFHFKNKKNIYSAVKSALVKKYLKNKTYDLPEEGNPEAQISYIINNIFKFYQENPQMLRLANWSLLEGDIDPWPGEDELHHIFLDIISSLQQRDLIRNDLTPMNILIMICGSVHIWWEYHQHFLKHLNTTEDPVSSDKNYRDEMLRLIIRGLSKN